MSDTPLFGRDDRVEQIETLLRELDAEDLDVTTPPADIWAGIETELRNDPDGRANVVEIGRRRRRAAAPFIAAAAAVAVIAAGILLVSTNRSGDDTTLATATLVHEADFDPLGADASATAVLIERDGSLQIQLDEATLPDPDGNDLELWLIAAEDDGSLDVQPVSLVDPGSPGVYDVPAGLDPAEFNIVDISIEPRDGDDAHSGRSILRGTLTGV